MATPKIIADFESQLSAAISINDTSFTLSSATDDDGVALPAGLYYFTLDNGSTNKEYLAGTLSGTSVTGVLNVTRQGTETSGALKAHRVGATVIITDFNTYKKYMDEISLVSAPDADTTTKGVLEASTLIEIRARTASGGSGAKLAATPDVLVDLPTEDEKAALVGTSGTPSTSNKFVTADDAANDGTSAKIIRANGVALPSGLIGGVNKKIAVGVPQSGLGTSSSSEVTIFSETVPADFLSTNNGVRYQIFVTNLTTANGTTDDPTFRLKYGSTTLCTVALQNSTTTNTALKGIIEGVLTANASASAQVGFMKVALSVDNNDLSVHNDEKSVHMVDNGTATETSSGALALIATIQWGDADAGNDLDISGHIVELIS